MSSVPSRPLDWLLEAIGPERAVLGLALERLDWAMPLPSASAPGFVYLAGSCGGCPVGGGGADISEAARRLAGETAEVIAQLAEPALVAGPGDAAIDADWSAGQAGARLAAVNLTRGVPVTIPAAAVCIGRFDAERGDMAPPRSLGLGAGPDQRAARLHGLLELIERDAAADWWLDGTPARVLDAAVAGLAGMSLGLMRAGTRRPTMFLELASRTAVPVVCALSRDTDGKGAAFGLKAHPSAEIAAQGAMIEMLQMELALELARHRAARGNEAAGDRGPLRRAALDIDRAVPILPAAAVARPEVGGLDDLVAHLGALGMEVTVADLEGAPEGMAVAKVFVPGLRPFPGGRAGARAGAPGTMADLM